MPFYIEHAKYGGSSQFLDANSHFLVDSALMNKDAVTEDTYGNYVVYPGTILAKILDSTRPTYLEVMERQSTPTYGPGSDVAIGILREIVDLTKGNKVIAFVTHGRVREPLCKDVGVVGTVAAATKTALPLIEWV